MKTILSLLTLFLSVSNSFSTSWIITNSGNTFSPSSLTIVVGDDVTFNLETLHNALEVSQATWNANGTTMLAGGFQTGFGGGQIQASQLGVGTHYYVCTTHASQGMKGTIIVQNVTEIEDNILPAGFSIYPNPSAVSLTLKANEAEIGSGYYITDLAGRIVGSGVFDAETATIDISYLARGTYLIGIVDQRRRPVRLVKL